MTTGRTLGVVLLSVLLAASLFGATVATGVERTALDEQYATDRFEEEQVDGKIGSDLRRDIATEIDRSNGQRQLPMGISIDLDGRVVANNTVTDEFISTELNRNVGVGIRYLRGETDDLDLRTDLNDIKAAIRTEISNGTTIDTPQLVGGNTGRVSANRVRKLSESEQQYREARVDLTTGERAKIEGEIETNVRQQLSNDSDELTAAILDHQYTVLDGLTGELTYEEYVEQLTADERRIKTAIGDAALTELSDEQSLVAEDDDLESALSPLRTGAGFTVMFSWLLPLLAIGLVGAVYGVTRSVDRTAMAAGTGLVVSGILGTVLGFIGAPVLKGAVGLSGSESDPVIEGLIAVVDGTLQTVGMQSFVLALIGVVILGVILGDRRGLFDGVRSRLDLDPRANHR